MRLIEIAGPRPTLQRLASRLLSENSLWHLRDDGEPLVHETKFSGTMLHLPQALAILRSMARPDALYPMGGVESVYFDGPSLQSYSEKKNGDLFKRKIRIRWYDVPGRTNASTAFLEVKDRVGTARAKLRRPFDADPEFLRSAPLKDHAWTSLLNRLALDAGVEIPPGYAPTISVRYSRRRFFCPMTGSRISLDYAIEASRVNPALLSSAPRRLDAIVCEAKSTTARYWPWNPALQEIGMRAASFSKYGLLISQLTKD